MARGLAKLGVNMVRVHGPAWGSDIRRVDKDYLDRLFYFIAALKKQGIYTCLSIYFPLWLQLKESDGFAGYGTAGRNPFALLFFNDEFQRIYRGWWRAVLTTPSPYANNKTLIDEPAVAMLEMINEDSYLFWTFTPYENIPGPQMALLEKQFGDWLAQKYGSVEKAFAAWGSGGTAVRGDDVSAGRAGFLPLYEIFTKRDRRAQDTAAFLTHSQKTFFERTMAFLKKDLGFKASVYASNWITADARVLGPLDKYANTVGDFWTATATSKAARGRTGVVQHQSRRPLRRPERAPVPSQEARRRARLWPADHGPPLQRAALDDQRDQLDAAQPVPGRPAAAGRGLRGASRHRRVLLFRDREPDLGGWAAQVLDPHAGRDGTVPGRGASVPQGAGAARRRGGKRDAAAGRSAGPQGQPGHRAGEPRRVPRPRRARRPNGGRGRRHQHRPARLSGRQGVDPVHRAGRRRRRVADGRSFPLHRPASADGAQPDRRASVELRGRAGNRNAPRAQGVTGFLKQAGTVRLKDVAIRSDLPYGAIVLVTLDDLPLARSKKMLLQVMSEEANYGWDAPPGPALREIRSIGGAPIVVRKFSGTVSLGRADADRLAVTALDANGYRGRRVGNARNLALGERTLYYLIEAP
jgi:hypothetical protein